MSCGAAYQRAAHLLLELWRRLEVNNLVADADELDEGMRGVP